MNNSFGVLGVGFVSLGEPLAEQTEQILQDLEMHFLVGSQYAEKVFLADPQSVGGFHRDDAGRTGLLGEDTHLANRCARFDIGQRVAGFAANAKTAGEQDLQLVAGIAECVDPLALFVAA